MFLPDQTQSKPAFALTDLALDSIGLPLIVQKLALLSSGHEHADYNSSNML